MIAIIFVWCLNFVISIANAWLCGKTWMASKAKGGLAHFMNWMGAIMSAAGFTWCYTIAAAAVLSIIPFTDTGADGVEVTTYLVTPEMMAAILNLGYLVVIFPILGSGLAITVSSWRAAARRRGAGDYAVAGWNTFAQVSNTVSAINSVPNVLGNLGGFFKGGSSDDKKGALVIAIVALALVGGIATTFGIIRMTASGVLAEDHERAEQARLVRQSAARVEGIRRSKTSR